MQKNICLVNNYKKLPNKYLIKVLISRYYFIRQSHVMKIEEFSDFVKRKLTIYSLIFFS